MAHGEEFYIMPALVETQLPFFRRDIEHGLVPPSKPGQSISSYHAELAILYNLPKDYITRTLAE